MKFASNAHGATREIANTGMLMPVLFEGLQMFGLRNLVEANVSINEESGCDKKVGEVPEEMTLAKKLHAKGTLRYFMTFKVQSRTTHQGMGRRCPKLQRKRGTQASNY